MSWTKGRFTRIFAFAALGLCALACPRALQAAGFTVGAAYAMPIGSDEPYKAGAGWTAGIVLGSDPPGRKGSKLLPSVNFVSRRFIYGSGGEYEFTSRVLLVDMQTLTAIGNRLRIGLGAYWSLALGSLTYTYGGEELTADYTSKTDFGFSGGLKLVLGKGSVWLEARYHHGLANAGSSTELQYREGLVLLGFGR